MTAATTGGYTVSASSTLTDKNPWEAFNPSDYWRSLNEYSTSDPYGYTGDEDITDTNGTLHEGEWLKLELPNKINISRVTFAFHSSGSFQPTSYVILGSNNDTSWTLIHTNENLSPGLSPSYLSEDNFTTVGYFKYLKLLVKNVIDATPSILIQRLRYYGHEEGSGSLDTTLKTVYNVPATTGTQLEVYYDGQDYTTNTDFDQANEVLDKSGNNLHGSQTGDVGFDSTYKAFTFGAGDYIQTQTLPSTFIDDTQHSIAMWFNLANLTDTRHLFWIDDNTTGVANQSPHALIGSDGLLKYDFFANHLQLLDQIVPNQWYHLVITFSGGNHNSGTKFYINGAHNTNVVNGGANTGDTLDIQASSYIVIGANNVGTTSTTFNGSIANFRLYSKVLNADQVKELYDYQKDYFLGSKSQVTLYKGHLGIGVAEPSGQLELAGDERLQEYPPRAMTHSDGTAKLSQTAGKSKNITYIEGHGEFKASASKSSVGTSGYDGQQPYNAFDKGANGWLMYDNVGYNTTSGAYEDNVYKLSASSGTPYGHWLKLEMPYTINIKSYFIDGSGQTYSPHDWQIWASNDDNNWTHIHSYSGETYDSSNGRYYTVSHAGHYKMFAIVVTSIHAGASLDRLWVGEMKYFGTPGPTTLDKGSLTLGRSLDVPRISRYDVDTETPRPEKLVVDFDTTVNSSPTDISGQGNHGTMTSGVSYSAADKAFKWDSSTTGRHIKAIITNTAGSWPHSTSFWFKAGSLASTQIIYGIVGDPDGTDGSPTTYSTPHISLNTNGTITLNIWGDGAVTIASVIQVNRWYHISITFDSTAAGRKLYVDGVLAPLSSTPAHALSMVGTTSHLIIGIYPHNSTDNPIIDGQFSNFKLYNVALEASEVQKLYRLGRTGRSMVISDTAVGIGKVPEAQLDVRGNINSEGIMTNKNYMFFATGPPSAMLQAGVAGGNDLVANFSRIEFILGSGFDTSTKTYTIPCSGYWEFSYCLLARNVATGAHWVMGRWLINGVLYDNRSFVYFSGQGGGSQESNLIGKIIGYYTAGTTISVRISQNSVGTDVYMNSNYSHFFGKLLH